MMEINDKFIEYSRSILKKHLNGIEECMKILNEEDIWWRPNKESNSIANLLLHLSGSLRQWVVSGVGSTPYDRVRQKEFDERPGLSVPDLMSQLRSTVGEADAVLAGIDPAMLTNTFRIFREDYTWLLAILHSVEHFSMHAGQIFLITKLRKGINLHLA
jgi:hypothetical protein